MVTLRHIVKQAYKLYGGNTTIAYVYGRRCERSMTVERVSGVTIQAQGGGQLYDMFAGADVEELKNAGFRYAGVLHYYVDEHGHTWERIDDEYVYVDDASNEFALKATDVQVVEG